jgi:creatinine amidohydrolase
MLVLADATWTDVRDLLAAAPDALVLLPVGALEAHGPHLPLSTDVIIAEGLARRAAAALEARSPASRVAIAPPLVYSVTDYAGEFVGTAGVSVEGARAYVADVCRGLRRAGFRRLCLVNAHLEPAHVENLRAVVAAARADGLEVVFADKTERRFARTLTEEYKRGACHAGSYETSLVLAEKPGLVRDDRRADLAPVEIDLARAMKEGKRTFREAGAQDAYFGRPAAATVEEGEWIYARLVEMVLTVVDETWPA